MDQTESLCKPQSVLSPIVTSRLRDWVKNKAKLYRISCLPSRWGLRTSWGGNLDVIKLHNAHTISSYYLIIISQIKDKDLNRKICMIIGSYLRNANKTAKTLITYDWKKKEDSTDYKIIWLENKET